MKTPMQELIEQFENRLSLFKEMRDNHRPKSARGQFKFLDSSWLFRLEAQIKELEASILTAEATLKKEKDVIMDAYSDGVDNGRALYECKDYYNETFNTKER
jgi:hypothetical protein